LGRTLQIELPPRGGLGTQLLGWSGRPEESEKTSGPLGRLVAAACRGASACTPVWPDAVADLGSAGAERV